MVNLLLIFIMIAALCGMVFCNRKQRKNTKVQLTALTLLVIVIASGGLFMCRLSSLSVLGANEAEKTPELIENKLRGAQGYVIANFIRNAMPECRKPLLIVPAGNSIAQAALIEQLRVGSIGSLHLEELKTSADKSDGELITPVVDRRAETLAIDSAIARHPDADVVIICGVSPSGESLRDLKVYRLPYSKRPKLIVVGLSNLNAWVARQIREGYFSALVVTDLTKVSQQIQLAELPENPVEIFEKFYILITQDNLKRNRRFFH